MNAQMSSLYHALTCFLVKAPLEPPFQWWPKTECGCDGKGTLPQHTYQDTTIVLNATDPSWNETMQANNTSYSEVYTSDGGTTWHIDTSEFSFPLSS